MEQSILIISYYVFCINASVLKFRKVHLFCLFIYLLLVILFVTYNFFLFCSNQLQKLITSHYTLYHAATTITATTAAAAAIPIISV